MEAVAVKQQAHTPGPWRSAMATSVDGPAPFDDSLVVATELKTEGIHDTICVVSPKGTIRERDKANAALIAAAPELLAALQKIVDEDMSVPDLVHLAEAAIAKATAV